MRLIERIYLLEQVDAAAQLAEETLGDKLGNDGVWDLITRDEFDFEIKEHIEHTGDIPNKNELADLLIHELTVLLEGA